MRKFAVLVLLAHWGMSGALLVSAGDLQIAPVRSASIAGVVVNERHEPLSHVLVQAFPAQIMDAQAQARPDVPPALMLTRASGSASTDDQGHFRISGLDVERFVIAAEPASLLPMRGSSPAAVYATTFYPSTLNIQQATPVSSSADSETMIEVGLLRVQGARLSGSVVS